MPPKGTPDLTSAQKKVLREAAASLDQAYATARKAISAAKIERPDDGGSTACLQPPTGHCKSFMPPKKGPSIRCVRPGCGHSFAKHDVF